METTNKTELWETVLSHGGIAVTVKDKPRDFVAMRIAGKSLAEVRRNAKMIAAAPTMLAALKAAEILAFEVGSESEDGVRTILDDERGDLWRMIVSAIAKAEEGAA